MFDVRCSMFDVPYPPAHRRLPLALPANLPRPMVGWCFPSVRLLDDLLRSQLRFGCSSGQRNRTSARRCEGGGGTEYGALDIALGGRPAHVVGEASGQRNAAGREQKATL